MLIMSKSLSKLVAAFQGAFAVRLLLIMLLFLLVGAEFADACPGCKDALSENDPQHARMVRGYFWSILFMMAMPFTIAGTFGTFFYLEVRRKRSADRAEESFD